MPGESVHVVEIVNSGFVCSCAFAMHSAATHHEAVRAASQHQLAAFVTGVIASERVTTTCLGCGAALQMPESNSHGLMHDYSEWIRKPCLSCGKTPQQVATQRA